MKKLLIAILVIIAIQTQAQNNCDSLGLGYITTQNTNYPFQAHAAVMPWVFSVSDSIHYNWTLFVGGVYYSSSNMAYTLFFHQMSLADTIKLCYDASTYFNNVVNTCSKCDSLIFNGESWVLFNTNPTLIKEINKEKRLLKVTDLLGRETEGKTNQPLLYLYDDGTVEKRIVIEYNNRLTMKKLLLIWL